MQIEGYIYILENPSYSSDIFKVGMTTRDPQTRAEELSRASGVPTPFKVIYSKFSGDVRRLEALAHNALSNHRYAKEFFQLAKDEIIKIVDSLYDKHSLNGPAIEKKIEKYITDITLKNIHASELLNNSLQKAWEQAYPSCKGIKYFKRFSQFIELLTQKILSLNPDIIVKFNDRSFGFHDGVNIFFDICPQSSKLTVAPLRLFPVDISKHNYDFRDITGKKYRMGGLVRVDLKRLDEADMALAFSLAKESYNSEVKFDTWSLLNKRKDRKRTK